MKSLCLLPVLFSLSVAWAQPPQPGGAPMPPAPVAPPAPPARRPPMERRLEGPPRWWENQAMAQKLGLTADQQKKMDDIFQQSRLKLIDLHATLEKEEAIMEPLMAADQPDETKLLAQIDKVAQARAELEKANGRMLVGMRRILTPEQWKKLQPEGPGGRGPQPHGPGGPGGPPPPPAPPNGGRGPGGPGGGPQQPEEGPEPGR
ncbi:MAG: Spy/CpxP family protein refolding chaperone [Bryobacteraceae bacterium]